MHWSCICEIYEASYSLNDKAYFKNHYDEAQSPTREVFKISIIIGERIESFTEGVLNAME